MKSIFIIGYLFSISFAQGASLCSQRHFIGDFSGERPIGWETNRIPKAQALKLKYDHELGEWLAEFSIDPSWPQISEGWRSELKDPMEVYPEATVKYRFYTRFLENINLKGDTHSVVIAQWHDRKIDSIPSQRPQLSFRSVNGNLNIYLWNDEVFQESCDLGTCGAGEGRLLYSKPYQNNHWYFFEVKAKWAADESGFIKIKIDNETVAYHKGPSTYRDDVFAPYFKFGIYTVHDFLEPMRVQHRNYYSYCID